MTPGLAPSATATATATPTAPEVADALHQPYSAAPRPLDVDGLRALARADEKSRVKTPLEKLHEREHIVRNIESKVADGAARAARKNCQTDYAGGGVFAIVPLLYGTLTDDGCKWK